MNEDKSFTSSTYQDSLEKAGQNAAIFDSFIKAKSVIDKHEHPLCCVSGGKDSDIVLDLIMRVDEARKTQFVWFNTGVEYEATKRQLTYLEEKYGIQIDRASPIKTVPISCKEFGQPFLSKFVSYMISLLQKHGFQWEDEPYEILCEKYSKCKSALAWWTNQRDVEGFGFSMFNIDYNKYLKEFMVQNPPTFRVSDKCCRYAKKDVSKHYVKNGNFDLVILGIRKAEGGIRAASYKNCFTNNEGNREANQYRPLFWYKDEDEKEYDDIFGVTHSDCYEVYGLRRTGCAGCPYNKKVIEELNAIEPYEPQMVKAANHIFKDSYEYTRQYREFVELMKNKS